MFPPDKSLFHGYRHRIDKLVLRKVVLLSMAGQQRAHGARGRHMGREVIVIIDTRIPGRQRGRQDTGLRDSEEMVGDKDG